MVLIVQLDIVSDEIWRQSVKIMEGGDCRG